MEKYDKDRACVKCGEVGAASRKGSLVLGRTIFDGNIVRTCRNCGHIWDEVPLDAKSLEPETKPDKPEPVIEVGDEITVHGDHEKCCHSF